VVCPACGCRENAQRDASGGFEGGWWGGEEPIVCSACGTGIIQGVIKIKTMAEGQLACVSAGACTARGGVVSRMSSTRSALATEMASLGRASDVNIHFHLDSDRGSSSTKTMLASSSCRYQYCPILSCHDYRLESMLPRTRSQCTFLVSRMDHTRCGTCHSLIAWTTN
jgi:hypothetical protein